MKYLIKIKELFQTRDLEKNYLCLQTFSKSGSFVQSGTVSGSESEEKSSRRRDRLDLLLKIRSVIFSNSIIKKTLQNSYTIFNYS